MPKMTKMSERQKMDQGGHLTYQTKYGIMGSQ